MDWSASYYDHFQLYFGKAAARWVFQPNPQTPSIQILSYEGVFPNCLTFASIGLSHFASELEGVGEVYFPVDDAWDQIPSLLANALYAVVQGRLRMGWGFTIGVRHIAPDFVKKFDKAALYFTNPIGLPKEFRTVQAGEQVGRVLLAQAITEQEYEFYRKVGAIKLEQFFGGHDVDTTHLMRQSSME